MAVRETNRETPMATLSVTANSRKRRPTMPGNMRMGMKTATSEALIESTVKPISLAPSMVAAKGFIPPSIWRAMFSMTTMASSTTKPVEMVRAMRDKLSRLYPKRYITPNVPTSERGTAILGMMVAQTLRRKTKTTRMTRVMEMMRVRSTS